MSEISRRKKGDNFADRVFANIYKIAEGGGLVARPDCCKAFREKPYPASKRGSDIKLDVTIEVWPPTANRWSFLWAFECKDWNRPIPPGELETFAGQLDQIAPFNRKALMVATGAFAPSAFEYAMAQGIALVRILPDEQIEYKMHNRMNSVSESGIDALTTPGYIGSNQDFFAISGGKFFRNWTSLFADMTVF